MRPSQLVRRLEDAILRRIGRGDIDARRIARLRARGVTIGERCWIMSEGFSTEPYLITIGDHVAIAAGVQFVTHEGSAWLLRDEHPDLQVFGTIRVGNDCLIGMNSIILPGTDIGARCVIGAGSVVKGVVPAGSVYAGNPARYLKRTEDLLARLTHSPNRLDLWSRPAAERELRLRHHYGC